MGAEQALAHPIIVNHIASSLNTPHIPSRKVALEILTFLCYWNDGSHHELVISSLEALSAANSESGPYAFWFKSLEGVLLGRGKMGSLVGASEEIRKNAGLESSLNEYAVSTFFLVIESYLIRRISKQIYSSFWVYWNNWMISIFEYTIAR